MAEIFRLAVPSMDEFLNIINRILIYGCFFSAEHHRDNFTDLMTFPIKYPSNIIIGQLNINSIRNKIELFSFLIGGKVDILLISETKIDNTFPMP